MIAKTFIGNNALALGLLTHITAIIIAMIPLGETGQSVFSVYIFGTFLISIGIFNELRNHQKTVLKHWHFYAASILSLLAVIGPLFSCWILYTFSEKETSRKSVGGFIVSLLTLKIYPIVLLIWSIAIAFGVSLLFRQYDPYFSHLNPL